jgi:kynureninase
VNVALGDEYYKVITPELNSERGAQVSIIARQDGKLVFDQLVANNVLGDWREPNVIRMSPVPLYNSFEDIFTAGELLLQISQRIFK